MPTLDEVELRAQAERDRARAFVRVVTCRECGGARHAWCSRCWCAYCEHVHAFFLRVRTREALR